jgi:plastocyanin
MTRIRKSFAIYAFCLAVPALALGDTSPITAVAGPGETITFTQNGTTVTHLDPGTYRIDVSDPSGLRDFTLRGPGVSLHTGFEPAGSTTWNATLKDGWYRYYDAAFEDRFHGQFSVGTPPPTTLRGTVNDTTIAFTDLGGSPVTHLDPGTYSIAVKDTSSRNSFRLVGPGVEEHTQNFPLADYTWTVTVADGTYSFYSERDPRLHGTFTVGTPAAAKQKFLHAIVGPDFAIGLVDDNWQPLNAELDRGAYTIDVVDEGVDHDFHLTGPGSVNKSSGPDLAFTGAQTWDVTFGTGGLYHFYCDPHDIMVGTFLVKAAPVTVKPKPKPKPKPKKKKKKKKH